MNDFKSIDLIQLLLEQDQIRQQRENVSRFGAEIFGFY